MMMLTVRCDPVDSYYKQVNSVSDNGLCTGYTVMARLDVADKLTRNLNGRSSALSFSDNFLNVAASSAAPMSCNA